MLSEAAPSAVAGAAVASEDAPNEQEELLVSQFSMILDEYIACHPVTTPALSEADVRFATAKYLLSRRRGGVVWPGENAARLAAILLILFVELLASSAITIEHHVAVSESGDWRQKSHNRAGQADIDRSRVHGSEEVRNHLQSHVHVGIPVENRNLHAQRPQGIDRR